MNIVWNLLKSWDGKVSATNFNKLVDAVQSIALNPGVNYTITRTPGGTTILPGGKAGAASAPPLTASISPDPSGPTQLKVTVSPGTVNQFIATNMFDSFTISSSGTYYVKAGVETDGQNVTSWTLYVDDSEPDAQHVTASSLPASFDVLLAIIKDGKSYRTIGSGSVVLNGTLQFITDKESPAGPGELTYIPYYAWSVSTD